MTLADWIDETRAKMREYGPYAGGRSAAMDFWAGALRRGCHALGFDEPGVPIYEREWDALVVLDTCRPDALASVAGGRSFVPAEIPTETSLGSTSWEWLARNFVPEYADEIARTAYVTANAHSRRFDDEFAVDADAFGRLDQVWEYGWDDEFGGIPPRPVTDRAVAAGREGEFDRLIVHYMQPHAPYRTLDPDEVAVGSAGPAGEAFSRSVWDLLQIGAIDRDRVFDAYRDNLEWVLDDVALLLENLDAERAVVTADHGEVFGEWGIYGHVRHVPLDSLKRVPWVETTATDTGTHEPSTYRAPERVSDDTVDERLEALGYR